MIEVLFAITIGSILIVLGMPAFQGVRSTLAVRNAKTIFNRAVDDDLIEVNPFDRLTGGVPPVESHRQAVGEG